MRCDIIIIESSHQNFNKYWNTLCESSLMSPLYTNSFFPYYHHYFKETAFTDFRQLVLLDNVPVLGLAILKKIKQNSEFSYFEMPVKLFSHLETTSPALQLALNALLSKLKELNFEVEIKMLNSKFIYSESFPNHNVSSIGKIFINLSTELRLHFEQFIDLELNIEEIHSDFSKSVKSALKKSNRENLKLRCFDQTSDPQSLTEAFKNLKELHFLASGEKTRSDESWNEQLNLLSFGNAFLVILYENSHAIGAALFYTNKTCAYYAVSAKNSVSNISISHLLVYEAIEYSKVLKLTRIYLGSQHSDKISSVSEKIRSIEKFKSFFGGELNYFFTAVRA